MLFPFVSHFFFLKLEIEFSFSNSKPFISPLTFGAALTSFFQFSYAPKEEDGEKQPLIVNDNEE